MEIDFSSLTQNGFDVEMGLEYTGSDENFLAVLQKYYRGAAGTKAALSDYLISRDFEGFTRTAHSLKSNSKMIGALSFAGLAEELERLGKAGDYSAMLIKTPEVIERLGDVLEIIRPYGEMEEVVPENEISPEEAKRIGEDLLEALDELDDERAAELTRQLMKYPFRTLYMNKLRDALDCISDYSYDEAAELVKKVLTEVEG